jgi:pyruvate-formate lyase-activating enzyme
MIKNNKMALIEKVTRKSMIIRPSGRSTDFISPSFGFGCLYDCTYCVTPDTLITTPQGLKMAGEIQEGDQVISFSLDTEKVETDLVTVIGQRDTDELYVIEVDEQTVTVTEEHPFYTKNRGWVEAKHLTEDDELLCDTGDLIQ